MLDKVGDNVDGEPQIILQHFGVKSCVLACRIGVEVPADGLYLFGDIARRASRRALEDHVLQ